MHIWLPAPRAGSGTDIYTERLARALAKRAIRTTITWFSPSWQFAPRALSLCPLPRGTTLIHTNSWYAPGFRRHVPLVLTEHQGAFGRDQRPYRSRAQELYHTRIIKPRLARSFAHCDAVTAVSAATARGLAQNFGMPSAHILHNFVDTAVFAPHPSRRPHAAPFRLLCVGNFTPLKGSLLLKVLLEALGPRFTLRFTTGARPARIGTLPANMHPIGRLSGEQALVDAYRWADAVLVPSFFEGFGYTALEAMACGTPVIASRTGGLPEIVTSETGIVCTPGDVAAFRAACERLATDTRFARTAAEAGRARALEYFSEDVIVPRYIALYETLHGPS